MRKILLLLLMIVAGGCAHGPATPDWLSGEPADYPASRYLSGRGQGETAALARDRARADLAKGFEVALHESSSDRLQWRQGGGKAGLQASSSRDISAQTVQVIKGIQIVQTWRAGAGGDSHALAVLDRLQAGQILRAEIDGLDAATAQHIARARGEKALPEKISAAYNALQAQFARQQPQKMLQIIDPGGVGQPAPYSLALLKNDLETLLDRWQIGLVVERDELGGLADILAGALGAAGIRSLTSPATADYVLKAGLDSEQLATPDGWHWRRGMLRIYLQEAAGGDVIGSHQWPYKSSARQAEMVDIRTRAQLADLLARDLLVVLASFGDIAPNDEP